VIRSYHALRLAEYERELGPNHDARMVDDAPDRTPPQVAAISDAHALVDLSRHGDRIMWRCLCRLFGIEDTARAAVKKWEDHAWWCSRVEAVRP
jgi:hypothetical protein